MFTAAELQVIDRNYFTVRSSKMVRAMILEPGKHTEVRYICPKKIDELVDGSLHLERRPRRFRQHAEHLRLPCPVNLHSSH